jgi:hypothetical protein
VWSGIIWLSLGSYEPLRSKKDRKFLDSLSDYQLLNKYSGPWSRLLVIYLTGAK